MRFLTFTLVFLAWTVAATDLEFAGRSLQDDSNSTEQDDGPDLDLTSPRFNNTDDGDDDEDPFHSLTDDAPADEGSEYTATNGGENTGTDSGAGVALPALVGVAGILSLMM